jgi:hypothetical protein
MPKKYLIVIAGRAVSLDKSFDKFRMPSISKHPSNNLGH